jgi:hypothetical protein
MHAQPQWGSQFSAQRFDAARWVAAFGAQVTAKLAERMDAGEKRVDSAYFLAPDLQQLLTDVFAIEYDKLLAAQYVPMRSISDGAASIRYRSIDTTGTAKWLGSGASDLPRADVSKSELSIKVDTLGMAFGYTIDELAAAAMAQQPLERDRAMACREAIERGADEALCMGQGANSGVYGLLNQDLATDAAELITLTTGTWAGATSLQIHADVAQMRNKMRTDTRGLHSPTHCGVPTGVWSDLTGRPWGTDNNARTIMSVLKENFPEIIFFEWPRLNTADVAGTGGRVVMFEYSPLNFWYGLARPFTPEAPQARGLEFEVPTHKRMTPGIAVARSLTIKYADNAI